MNKERRKAIEKASKTIDELLSTFEDLISEIDAIRDDEQGAFDGMPESLQSGDRGQAMESAICQLEDAISEVESARDSLQSAIENLNNASE